MSYLKTNEFSSFYSRLFESLIMKDWMYYFAKLVTLSSLFVKSDVNLLSWPRGYKTWVQPQTQNKVQWLAPWRHVSASSQSLRFILSLRLTQVYNLGAWTPDLISSCSSINQCSYFSSLTNDMSSKKKRHTEMAVLIYHYSKHILGRSKITFWVPTAYV